MSGPTVNHVAQVRATSDAPNADLNGAGSGSVNLVVGKGDRRVHLFNGSGTHARVAREEVTRLKR
jgi:hypothetical protein